MICIKENKVFCYKKWWKTISISFPKSSEAIHINFSTNLYRILWQGFTLNRLFFVLFSREITKKSENTVFGYKKASKFKENIIFENFGVWLYEGSYLKRAVWCIWFSKQNIFVTIRDTKNSKLGLCRGRSGLSCHEKILVNTCWPNMWKFWLKWKSWSKNVIFSRGLESGGGFYG